jgi:hypothetical protein
MEDVHLDGDCHDRYLHHHQTGNEDKEIIENEQRKHNLYR